MTLMEAKMNYIRAWQTLPEYGLTYFIIKLQGSKKEVHSMCAFCSSMFCTIFIMMYAVCRWWQITVVVVIVIICLSRQLSDQWQLESMNANSFWEQIWICKCIRNDGMETWHRPLAIYWCNCCILHHFYVRQHICYSAYMPRQFRLSVRLSIRLSHACFVSKRLNASSKFFHCLIAPSFYFYDTKDRCSNLTASPTTGAPNTRGVAIFDQYAAISRKR